MSSSRLSYPCLPPRLLGWITSHQQEARSLSTITRISSVWNSTGTFRQEQMAWSSRPSEWKVPAAIQMKRKMMRGTHCFLNSSEPYWLESSELESTSISSHTSSASNQLEGSSPRTTLKCKISSTQAESIDQVLASASSPTPPPQLQQQVRHRRRLHI